MNDDGYTLIEVLVALALLSVAVVPLLTSYVVTWRSSIDARRRSRAIMLSRWKMGELRAMREYTDISNQDKSSCTLKPPYDEVDDEYDCSVEVVRNIRFDETRTVTVRVFYNSPFGGESTVELTSTISCLDVEDC